MDEYDFTLPGASVPAGRLCGSSRTPNEMLLPMSKNCLGPAFVVVEHGDLAPRPASMPIDQ